MPRFEADGDRLWVNPPSVSMTGAVRLAADGSGGVYVAGVANGGLLVRHVLASGREAPWGASSLPGLGLTQPRVDAVTANGAGDLFVAYSSVVSVGKPGVALLTYTGGWSDVGPAGASPEWYSGAVPDGSGGAYVLGRRRRSGALAHRRRRRRRSRSARAPRSWSTARR